MKRQHLNYFQRGGVHGCTEGKIPEVEVKKGSPSVHSNHAVFVVVAHFHGAVSPRLVPIKQPGGGLLKIPSNYAVVFGGRQDRQVAVRQQVWAPLPLPDCPTGSIQHTTWDHTPLPSVHNRHPHHHVTEGQEAVHKKDCSSLCKSDSQIQCHEGEIIPNLVTVPSIPF